MKNQSVGKTADKSTDKATKKARQSNIRENIKVVVERDARFVSKPAKVIRLDVAELLRKQAQAGGPRITDEEMTAASRRGLEASVRQAHAVGATYNRETKQLVIELRGGTTFWVPARLLQGLRDAAPELLDQVEVMPGGAALHWEELDADFLVQDLVCGSFGSRLWMERLRSEGLLDVASGQRLQAVDELLALQRSAGAAQMGRRGGAARTPAKAEAARANGAKGGRPKRST